MTNSGDAFQKQHTVDELIDINPNKDILTPEDEDEEQIAGGEENTDLDNLHKRAIGDEDDLPLDDEINKDEIAIAKDLTKEEQEK